MRVIEPRHDRGIFIFRRDLRVIDNRGLEAALRDCHELLLCFIFTPEQVNPRSNPYRSKRAIQFMMESLADLKKGTNSVSVPIRFFYGKNVQVIRRLLVEYEAKAVYFNRDVTPYAHQRDAEIESLCRRLDVNCTGYDDEYNLHVPGSIYVASGRHVKKGVESKGMYRKFSPFYEQCLTRHTHVPRVAPNSQASMKARLQRFAHLHRKLSYEVTWQHMYQCLRLGGDDVAGSLVKGGRTHGLDALARATRPKTHDHYAQNRDQFTYDTTYLSAYLKFGCVSVREVYHRFVHRFGLQSELVRQLIWREFFAHILAAHPEVIAPSDRSNRSYGSKSASEPYSDPLNLRLDTIRWAENAEWLQRWKDGTTGFPLVDACMRQLNQTGYMHNRGRMLVAHFLVKILWIDWREGERYFAQQLVDYDVASNNGNWAAILGRGVYQSPYFRVMSPWRQSAQYDTQGVYMYRWVPELAGVPPQDLHRWYSVQRLHSKITDYPPPMVDYEIRKYTYLHRYPKLSV